MLAAITKPATYYITQAQTKLANIKLFIKVWPLLATGEVQ